MTYNLLIQFLGEHDYDVRKTGNGRWIDQKCAPDEISFVATCVLEYVKSTGSKTFRSPDVWHHEFSMLMVQGYFSKPDPAKEQATDEYNKFFRQPLKLFSAAGILSECKNGIVIDFTIENKAALEYIAESDWNAYLFLRVYIEKTLRDSELWDDFASFLDAQDSRYYDKVKTAFREFCFKHTPIRNSSEAGRIFAKVLNPLACFYRKRGTVGGRISSAKILFTDLKYNRLNIRDVGKDKDVTRQEAESGVTTRESPWTAYKTTKAKGDVNQFNKEFNGGLTEVVSTGSSGLATQMHHMFMQSICPTISDFRENIVALTPTQHMNLAHPNNNTSKIDPEFQRICLQAKTVIVRNNILHNYGPSGFYDFGRLMEVLDTGFDVDEFSSILDNDFLAVQEMIDAHY